MLIIAQFDKSLLNYYTIQQTPCF